MSKQNKSEDAETISQKMARLDELVQWFEGDDFSLEKSFEVFEEAQALAKEIENNLKQFSNKVSVLAKKFDEA